jgi:hypothetical protein
MTTKSTKASSTKSSTKTGAADLTKRLGPVRRVVKMTRASETEASYNLHLECKHVRVGTKRKSLRCRRCRGAAKK